MDPLERATIELEAAAKIVKMLKELHRRVDRDNHGEESSRGYMHAIEDIIKRIEEEKWRLND